ncbi:Hypothetical_protein [Hexamita inflata]|uniref:Hypothetical_protein n=1 Tax=Hexamita inflata TaxID=28002 RepID=A0ABP1GI18_9EUKA
MFNLDQNQPQLVQNQYLKRTTSIGFGKLCYFPPHIFRLDLCKEYKAKMLQFFLYFEKLLYVFQMDQNVYYCQESRQLLLLYFCVKIMDDEHNELTIFKNIGENY